MRKGKVSQRDFAFLRFAWGSGVVKILQDTPWSTPVGRDEAPCHEQGYHLLHPLTQEGEPGFFTKVQAFLPL